MKISYLYPHYQLGTGGHITERYNNLLVTKILHVTKATVLYAYSNTEWNSLINIDICDIWIRENRSYSNLIFHHEKNDAWINSHSKQLSCSTLEWPAMLLAAFLKHSGDLYKQFGVQMEAWPVLGWLWLAAQLWGVE